MSAAPQLTWRQAGLSPTVSVLIAALGLFPTAAQQSSAGVPRSVLEARAAAANAGTASIPAEKGKVRKRETRPAPAAIEDVAGLPRVLLIGDHGWGPRSGSNAAGYTLVVRELLMGQANVHRVSETGVHADKAVASLDKWLGNKPREVLHFNFGLHDLKRRDDGQPQVPIEQ